MSTPGKKTTIVFAINDMTVGGAQKLIIDMCKRFDPERYSVHLISFFELPYRPDVYHDVPPYVEVHRFKFKGMYDIRAWLLCIKTLKKIKPDAVISHLFFSNFVKYAAVNGRNRV